MREGGRELHKVSFSEKVSRILSPREWRWRFYSKAREQPAWVFRNHEEAKMYVHRQANSRSLGMYEEEMRKAEQTPEYSRARHKHGELLKRVLYWMDDIYTGPAIHAAMVEYPPVLVTVGGTPSLFPIGDTVYYGTNCISTRMFWKDEGMAGAMLASIAHEVHHYACWLGKGRMIRWRDERGRPVFWKKEKEGDSEFTEALTEMLAVQLLWENGVKDFGVAGSERAYLALHLQEIAGKDAIRKAYFSGDYTVVREKVNAALGEWAFEEVVCAVSERGIFDGLLALQGRAREAGFVSERMYMFPFAAEIYGKCRYDVPVFPFSREHGEFK